MPATQDFTVEGGAHVAYNIGRYLDDKVREVQERLEEARRRTLARARADAPELLKPTFAYDTAQLKRGAITAEISAGNGLETPEVAGYLEWGTGENVRVLEGLEDYAMTFFVTGEGRLPPRPYLFPNAFLEMNRLVRDLSQ